MLGVARLTASQPERETRPLVSASADAIVYEGINGSETGMARSPSWGIKA